MQTANPTEIRKAAAFVEKIGQLEEEFGYVLHLDKPVLLGKRGSKPVFALAREDAPPTARIDPLYPTGLALGMVTPEPAGPAFPIPGRR